jgi:molybdate transport system substrate-binding protein
MMKLKSQILLALILALVSAGCAQQTATIPTVTEAANAEPISAPAEALKVNVFAAASLSEPFGEIGQAFEAQHPGATVVFNFAGSQQLAQQINLGAPADVFASANNTQMNAVIQAGEIISGTQQTFARNRLVVIFPQDNPGGLKELKDLAKPGLKLVLAARDVPVGGYALNFLDKASADPTFGATFKDDVIKNVVSYEDNVKTVLTKVALGEADAGIVYTSDISGKDTSNVGRLNIPDALNVIASYPIAPIKDNKNSDLTQAFINLVLSSDGQAILAKYNFIPLR